MLALRFIGGAIGVASLVLSTTSQAQILPQAPRPATAPSAAARTLLAQQCTSASKVNAQDFYVVPPLTQHPLEGQRIEVHLTMKNVCNGALNIPWRITRFDQPLASGVQPNVPAGQVFEVKAGWTATAGNYSFYGYADPGNSLGDTGPDRYNRTTRSFLNYAVGVAAHWSDWGSNAKLGARAGIRAAIVSASVKGNVTLAEGRIPKGGVDGGSGMIMGPLYAAMGAGVPAEIKSAFQGALKDAWDKWASNYEMPPGLILFPQFLSYAAPITPRMPAKNPVLPLRLGISNEEGALSATSLATAVRNRLVGSSYASQPGADAAVNDFAQYVSALFTTWKTLSGSLCSIEGWGPVPTFAPPIVNAGPVVGGTVAAKLCGDF